MVRRGSQSKLGAHLKKQETKRHWLAARTTQSFVKKSWPKGMPMSATPQQQHVNGAVMGAALGAQIGAQLGAQLGAQMAAQLSQLPSAPPSPGAEEIEVVQPDPPQRSVSAAALSMAQSRMPLPQAGKMCGPNTSRKLSCRGAFAAAAASTATTATRGSAPAASEEDSGATAAPLSSPSRDATKRAPLPQARKMCGPNTYRKVTGSQGGDQSDTQAQLPGVAAAIFSTAKDGVAQGDVAAEREASKRNQPLPQARKMCGPSTYRRIAAAAVNQECGSSSGNSLQRALSSSGDNKKKCSVVKALTGGGTATGRLTNFEDMADASTTSSYVLMLRVCQGLVSPLDGVTHAACPRQLFNLASKCCALKPEERPDLSTILTQLEDQILKAVDPGAIAGARRPTEVLKGWRDAAEKRLREQAASEAAASDDGASQEWKDACRASYCASLKPAGRARSSRVSRSDRGAGDTDASDAAADAVVAEADGPLGAQSSRLVQASIRQKSARSVVDAHSLPAPVASHSLPAPEPSSRSLFGSLLGTPKGRAQASPEASSGEARKVSFGAGAKASLRMRMAFKLGGAAGLEAAAAGPAPAPASAAPAPAPAEARWSREGIQRQMSNGALARVNEVDSDEHLTA